MVLIPAQVDYTDKDYEALYARLIDLIASVYPKWTNHQSANFGNVLMQSWCFIGDVLSFYQDQQALEGRFATVQLRKNMIALTKLINYSLSGASAATCDVKLTITNAAQLVFPVTPSSANVVIGTAAITDPIKGELQGTISFAAGETEKTFSWEHSITQPPYIIASTGRADQRILLPFGPFLEDSEEVSTPSQPIWTKVTSFYNSGPTDTHYRVEVDQNNLATVIYGDGRNGVVPVGDMTIPYKTGGGVTGNVEAGSLKKVETGFVDSVGTKAYIEATNELDAEGGVPREEVDAARINAPQSLRVLNRTVSREDYEINAKRVPEVGRALMITSNEFSGIEENHGQLFIIPKTGGTAGQAILDSVYVMCTETYPNTITFQLEVLPASYLTIDVYAVVYLSTGAVASTVRAAALAGLQDFFEPMLASGAENPNVDFGYNYKDEDGNPAGEVAWSDIQDIVRDTAGIRKVGAGSNEFTLNGLRADVPLPLYKFPKLGTVTLINGATGTAL